MALAEKPVEGGTRSGQAQVERALPRTHRRPSGEAPPLPRDLKATGKLLLAWTGVVFAVLLSVAFIGSFGESLDRWEGQFLAWLAELRTPFLTSIAKGITGILGYVGTIGVLRWGTVLLLIVFRRFRHLFVLLGCLLGVEFLTSGISTVFVRARPLGVDIIGDWVGSSIPAKPVAALAVTLMGITYSLVVPGSARTVAKWITFLAVGTLGAARMYLGVDHPLDYAMGAVLGFTIPVVAFRSLTPNEVFPVAYRGGRSAHLDVTGPRGDAIRLALEEQLGITLIDMKPFGLAGSGGSTPLRLRVAGEEGEPDRFLFAKLYARNHLRADRWYKLGRTLLYGRLEDEKAFNTVRRLVQYEDYLLRVMRDAGVPTPKPHGFVEITPEREYLLVTDFVEDARELLDAEVTDRVIDNSLQIVCQLWNAGLAHRDVKPSNILVRGEDVHLIDVAFGEVRPSPWRQAVDLANMMVALALPTDPERVYARAVHFFTPQEIAEAFAATHSVTIPSQSRAILRKSNERIVQRFRELAPHRKPISIQRWSWRRVGLTIAVLFSVFLVGNLAVSELLFSGVIAAPGTTTSFYAGVPRAPECGRLLHGEQMILQAQSVPTASLLPCLNGLPAGWTFLNSDIRSGSTIIYLASDRAGNDALRVRLERTCNTTGATRVPSDEAGTLRFERVNTLAGRYSGTRYYRFEGGCVSYRFDFLERGRSALANEVSLALGFESRADVARRYEAQTGLRF